MGRKNKPLKFYKKVLTPLQGRILQQLGPIMLEKGFYLGGGTALSLYFGHRHSVDFDWFTNKKIGDSLILAQDIRDHGIDFDTSQVDRGTLYGTISGIRVSFLEYRYPMLKMPIRISKFRCPMASPEDIACMKLSAISQRGSKKDFVDIYALSLRQMAMDVMIRLYQKKYSIQDILHVLYGLAYFDEADRERMPKMYWKVDWRTIKKTIQEELRELTLKSEVGFADIAIG